MRLQPLTQYNNMLHTIMLWPPILSTVASTRTSYTVWPPQEPFLSRDSLLWAAASMMTSNMELSSPLVSSSVSVLQADNLLGLRLRLSDLDLVDLLIYNSAPSTIVDILPLITRPHWRPKFRFQTCRDPDSLWRPLLFDRRSVWLHNKAFFQHLAGWLLTNDYFSHSGNINEFDIFW